MPELRLRGLSGSWFTASETRRGSDAQLDHQLSGQPGTVQLPH